MPRMRGYGIGILVLSGLLGAGPSSAGGQILWDQRGVVEVRTGLRLAPRDPAGRFLLAELRAPWDGLLLYEDLEAAWRCELLGDLAGGLRPPSWKDGGGWLDVREVALTWHPVFFVDIHLGRRILSWGAGDLVFANDLFPKDYSALAAGRPEEYLYAPADMLHTRIYPGYFDLDLVYMPRFHPYRHTAAERLAAVPEVAEAPAPAYFANDAWAWRLRKEIRDITWALYGYLGYWPEPQGRHRLTQQVLHPRLQTHGAGAETSVSGVQTAIEAAYYHTMEDDPDARGQAGNEIRAILSLRRPLGAQWMAALQYDLRYAWARTGEDHPRTGHGVGGRLTWQEAVKNGAAFSLLARYVFMDANGWLRAEYALPLPASWTVTAGSQLVLGEHDHVRYRVTRRDSSLFASLRRDF